MGRFSITQGYSLVRRSQEILILEENVSHESFSGSNQL